MAADLIPASRRTEGIGLYTLANTIGMALGPHLGIYVLQRHGPRWLFTVSACAGILALGIDVFVSYESKRRRAGQTLAMPFGPLDASAGSGGRWDGVVEKSILRTCLVFLFVVMPYGGIMAYVAAYGIDRGVGGIGLYFTVFAVALFVVRIGFGRLSDRYGVTVAFVPGVVAMFAGLLML